MAYFPMFIDLNMRKCLVVGGGKIAVHKVRVLQEFGAEIYVVAGKLCKEMQKLIEQEQISYRIGNFEAQDLEGADLVVTATDHWEVNHRVAELCRDRKILVNAVDQQEDCDFIFPSYVREGDLVGAFSSSGKSPVMTQYLKKIMRKELTPFLGEVADALGAVREQVKREIAEEKRRECFEELLQWCLEEGAIPEKEVIEAWIERKRSND